MIGRKVPNSGGVRIWTGVVLTGLLGLTGAPDAQPAEARSAAELYRAACSSCHGLDGTGSSPEVVGFEEPLPDFTLCTFASREPDGDWLAVIHEGGPVRGFARMMPSFAEALTVEEMELALSHVRTFCSDDAWPRGELNLPRPLVTEKAYLEDEAVWTVIVDTEGAQSVTNKLVYEKRFGVRNQFEIVVPFGWREREAPPSKPPTSTGWTGGVGDVALGVKRALFHSAERGSIVSFTGEVILPSGDEEDGFGKGTAVVEPFVTWGQILPADGFLQLQGGAEIPVEGGYDDEAFLRAAVGKSFTTGRFGRVWSPMVELLGARDLVSGATTHWDILPQAQVTLNTRQHVMANVGVRIPVNDTAGRDVQVLVYVLWDWFDGPLFDGW